MSTNNYLIDMKFLLRMTMMTMVVGLSNAGRIPRGFHSGQTHDNFPNLQTVHHGHGATSYQNVEIDNQAEISIPRIKSHTSHHHFVYPDEHHDHEVPYLSLVNENQFILSHDAEPYTQNNVEHVAINNIAEEANYYEHYDQEYDYGYN